MISILSEDNKYTWGYPHNGFMGYTKRDASVLKDIKNGKFPNMYELI
jgi:hypothetical protein